MKKKFAVCLALAVLTVASLHASVSASGMAPPAETESSMETAGEASTEPESETQTSTESESETEASTEPESETEPSTEPESETEGSTEPESETEPSTEPEGETQASTKPQSGTQASTEPESNQPCSETASKPASTDIIQTRFRIFHGRPQYRRWNETRKRWKDSRWRNDFGRSIKNLMLHTGTSVKLKVGMIEPRYAYRPVYWKSNKPRVVRAYKSGRILAKKKGSAWVMAIQRRPRRTIAKIKVIVGGKGL